MSLEQKIGDDIKAAMLARDSKKLEAVRAIKAAILLEKTKEGAGGTMDETTENRILQKLVKQRRESAEIYAGQQERPGGKGVTSRPPSSKLSRNRCGNRGDWNSKKNHFRNRGHLH